MDLLVATILSAQCTDARVNIVTKTVLFPKYRKASDYIAVPARALERDIRTCGFFRTKTRSIQAMCRTLLNKHDGKVPRTMQELVALPGVGRKTASVILHAAFDVSEGIAVDTHVRRVSRRLGLTRHRDPTKIELDLCTALPKEHWGEITTLLISHGRAVCTARNRQCEKCVFKKKCPSSLIMGKKDLAKE